MKVVKYPKAASYIELLSRPIFNTSDLNQTVTTILSDVRNDRDEALKKYALKFDQVEISNFQVSKEEVMQASKTVSTKLKDAIKLAKTNIEKFHRSQIEESKRIETTRGITCWRKSVAIEKVGLYIPGGTAPLFSTILMIAIPAIIAGCDEVVLCTPCDSKGEVNAAILYTADLLGISQIYKVGGAQAIAAMAYGTESIPQVFKIFGPGNQYVTKAKSLVQQDGVAIDMPAGPSEVLIIADKSSNPRYIAADLLSQAEHGSDSQVILVSDSENTISKVLQELDEQVKILPRQTIAKDALKNSRAVLLKDLTECFEFSNLYAPEHLILNIENSESFIDKIVNAGSVFLGQYSCESLGDYASGTNHTLPTNGYARSYSGASLDSFVKKITFQKVTKSGLQNIGPAVEIMAEAEGLQAHKNAVSLRLKNVTNV